MYCVVLLVAAYFIKASGKKTKKQTTQPKLPQETPRFLMNFSELPKWC